MTDREKRDKYDKWAKKMQRKHAVSIYHDFWGDDCEVIHNDSEAENENVALFLDMFGDIDKIIKINSNGVELPVYMAQRFRTIRNNGALPDFSFRWHPDKTVEWDRLKEGYLNDNLNSIPGRYAFGRACSQDKTASLELGFRDFFVFDTEAILRGILETNRIELRGPVPNGDETYFKWMNLRELESCIVERRSYNCSPDAEREEFQSALDAYADGGFTEDAEARNAGGGGE